MTTILMRRVTLFAVALLFTTHLTSAWSLQQCLQQ